VPAELKAVKSFREALKFLLVAGHNTPEKMTRACYMYGAVPCIGRYLAPNPDPEMAIEKRVERALAVLTAESAA
jgi:hypothetical protein